MYNTMKTNAPYKEYLIETNLSLSSDYMQITLTISKAMFSA
ncbi:hypothetical protein [Oceanobacillus limi]|nr:hypothetical protein [Oceanobacillus limi]